MSDLAKSFASLVKSNNGMFKSEAQAKFLLSQCDSNEFVTVDSMYGNSYNNTYTCDDKGVVKVTHYTQAKRFSLVWERVEAGKVAVQESKEFKRIMREIKRIEKSIAEREAAYAEGKYAEHQGLYESSKANDYMMLAGYQAKL